MNLTGPGAWGFDRSRLGDLPSLASRLLVPLGFKWFAIKNGVPPKTADAWRAVGVEPVYWWYSTPQTTFAQLDAVKAAKANGFTSFIVDAEVEWETIGAPTKRSLHDWRPQAKEFASRVRQIVGPDSFFADAPYVLPSASHLFPFREFGAEVNVRMPQLYYSVAALDRPWPSLPSSDDLANAARKYLARADLEWAQQGGVICPILANVNANGSKRMPVADLKEAWERYLSRPCRSLWSIEWVNEAEHAYFESTRFEDPAANAPQTKDGPAA